MWSVGLIMSNLAICYREVGDTTHEIQYKYGFEKKEGAGKAKLEIGTSLLEKIVAEGGIITHHDLNDCSWRWLYNTSSVRAAISGSEIQIVLGAKHRWKRSSGLPVAGVFSDLFVCCYGRSYGSNGFLHSSFAQEIKKYLNEYEPVSL